MTTFQSKEKQSKNDEPSALRSLIAGAGAGVICTLLCAPLDVTKVRLQVQGSLGNKHFYSGGIYSSLKKIYLEEGIRGVFKGVGPALVTVPLFWGVYWPIYDHMKKQCENNNLGISERTGHMLSALTAGVVGDIITNPFWVVRTRIQTLAMHSEVKMSAEITTVQMMKFIYETEGWKAFYKGLGASFLGLSHVAIQFPLYEFLKQTARNNENRPESFLELLMASTTAKLVASSITYPHEVIRARLQDSRSSPFPVPHCSNSRNSSSNTTTNSGRRSNSDSSNSTTKQSISRNTISTPIRSVCSTTTNTTTATAPNKTGIISIVQDIIQKEGFFALWSGLRVSMFRIVPATASTFLAYEYLSRYLREYTEL